jgi:hypothetical protein
MSILVILLRAASLLAFAGPILLTVGGRDRKRSRGADRHRGDRTPVVANFAAFGLFFAFLARVPRRWCWRCADAFSH